MSLVHLTIWLEKQDFVREKGILATLNPKSGYPVVPETADLVCRFYESDDMSKLMPGKKDFIAVKQGDGHVHV